MAHTVLEDLLEKVKAEKPDFALPQKGESEQKFLNRLVIAVGNISEAGWLSLHGKSQEWFNLAGQAINEFKPIPDCPGYQAAIPPEPIAEVPNKAPVREHQLSPNPTTPGPSRVDTKTRRGVMARTREICISNPKLKYPDVIQALKDEGWENLSQDTVYLCFKEVENVLSAASRAGYFLSKFEAK